MSCGCQYCLSHLTTQTLVKSNKQTKLLITQLSDNGFNISLSLIEDIELESVSQQQLMLEAIDRSISDDEVKKQIKPILEAILRSQPQTVIKTYPKTVIQINMPRKKYENIGSPAVGNKILIDIKPDTK